MIIVRVMVFVIRLFREKRSFCGLIWSEGISSWVGFVSVIVILCNCDRVQVS